MKRHKLFFGVFDSTGKVLFKIGMPVEITLNQAELIACILELGIKPALRKGDYLAFDYEEGK